MDSFTLDTYFPVKECLECTKNFKMLTLADVQEFIVKDSQVFRSACQISLVAIQSISIAHVARNYIIPVLLNMETLMEHSLGQLSLIFFSSRIPTFFLQSLKNHMFPEYMASESTMRALIFQIKGLTTTPHSALILYQGEFSSK